MSVSRLDSCCAQHSYMNPIILECLKKEEKGGEYGGGYQDWVEVGQAPMIKMHIHIETVWCFCLKPTRHAGTSEGDTKKGATRPFMKTLPDASKFLGVRSADDYVTKPFTNSRLDVRGLVAETEKGGKGGSWSVSWKGVKGKTRAFFIFWKGVSLDAPECRGEKYVAAQPADVHGCNANGGNTISPAKHRDGPAVTRGKGDGTRNRVREIGLAKVQANSSIARSVLKQRWKI